MNIKRSSHLLLALVNSISFAALLRACGKKAGPTSSQEIVPYAGSDDSPSTLGNAKWVWADNSDHNTWVNFRKTFTLDSIPNEAIAEIAVENKYMLYVNGNAVVRDGGLKRGYSPTDGFFDKVDLSPYLVEGENVIAVKAWFWGTKNEQDEGTGLDVSYNNVQIDNPGFIFGLKAGSTTIVSDDTWKAKVDAAFKNDTLPGYNVEQPNLRFPEYNVYFDANDEEDNGFETASFSDASWSNAIVKGNYGDEPWNKLHERPIPLYKEGELTDYENSKDYEKYTTSKDEEITVNIPYNAQFTPYLKVSADKACRISIKTENTYSTQSLKTNYITSANGEQEFESPSWINGSKVTYTIPSGVKIISLKYRESGYNTNFSGSFSTNDSFYTNLWEMARRTQYVCMRDSYMDCPDRERSQWTGDAVLQMRIAGYSMTPSTYALYRKMMHQKVEWSKIQVKARKHVLPTVTPITNMLYELPAQELAGIVSMHDYYLLSGDSDLLYETYDAFLSYVQLWDIDDVTGLVFHKTGCDVLRDWQDTGNYRSDTAVQENSLYYWACSTIKEMGQTIGKDTSWLDERMKQIKSNFSQYWIEGSGYATASTYVDDRANAFAVLSGLADKEKYETIINVLKTTEHASSYTENYVLMAMFEMGYKDEALARMKSRFEPMVQTNIEKGYTTLWEYFQEGMGTYNHAWSGGSLFLLSKYVGGISSTSAGFKSYNIKPVLDNFETLETKVNTLDGDISVKKNGKTLTVTVPNGNGSLILDGVKSITTNNDDKCSVTNTESAITVKINEAGTYTFQYEK